jgi:hypothetical protein
LPRSIPFYTAPATPDKAVAIVENEVLKKVPRAPTDAVTNAGSTPKDPSNPAKNVSAEPARLPIDPMGMLRIPLGEIDPNADAPSDVKGEAVNEVPILDKSPTILNAPYFCYFLASCRLLRVKI